MTHIKAKYTFSVIITVLLASGCSFYERDNPIGSNSTFDYGTLTDSRDGKTYKTIIIGTQTWMAENLNIGTRINGSANQTDNAAIEKYAYDDNESNATTYGGLYQWDEAMGYSTTEGVKGICPNGWHLPTDAEWDILVNSVGGSSTGGTALKQGGSSGFQALLSGSRFSGGSFHTMGSDASFWSSSQLDAARAWYRYLLSGYPVVGRYDNDKAGGFCVRCLKD